MFVFTASASNKDCQTSFPCAWFTFRFLDALLPPPQYNIHKSLPSLCLCACACVCVCVCVREREREREETEMQWASRGSRNTLIERAKEELEILESQHPNNFHCLKLELKAFISEFESQNLLQNSISMCPCPSAATQESSSIKKRKRCGSVVEDVGMVETSAPKVGSLGSIKRRCKTDAVLERAQECLHKIQHFKTSL